MHAGRPDLADQPWDDVRRVAGADDEGTVEGGVEIGEAVA
jgi:hypothetical protein